MNLKTLTLALALIGTSGAALADGCYTCEGGDYVQFSGSDDQSKRKAAEDCGCKIVGTRSSCDAANLTILCTVANESQSSNQYAVNESCSELTEDAAN